MEYIIKENKKDTSLGIERHVDELGRVVIPKEMRRRLNIKETEEVSIRIFNNYIEIKKANSSCIFCGNKNDLEDYNDNSVCQPWLNNII